jgi:RNA polymerase sigma-70 factor, ECF subfamily
MRNHEHLDDDELIRRSRSGDENAFRILVDRYEPRVAAVVVGMLGSVPEADDVGQEVFIRFFRSLDRFRGDATLATYLTRIAINQSLKALKKRKRWYDRFLNRDEQDEAPDPASDDSPVSVVEASEQAAYLRHILSSLSDEHRAVIVLRVMEGYSTKETAAMLDVPEGTVMSRLKRGLAKMKDGLNKEDVDL